MFLVKMMAFFLLFSLISVVICEMWMCVWEQNSVAVAVTVTEMRGDDVHSEIPEINNDNVDGRGGGGGFMQMPI